MKKEDATTPLKRLWYFIWHDDSIASWIANIILAFFLIKYLVYPLLGAVLGTAFPVVAVVSPSMEHNQAFGPWWQQHGGWYEENSITKADFSKFPMTNGFNEGDIIFLRYKKPAAIEVGEVIVFISHRSNPRPDPIIHRVVKKWETPNRIHFTTKGDNNNDVINDCGSDCLDETNIFDNQVIGKATFRIPLLGWIKIAFVKSISKPYCTATDNLWPCRS
jgi:signal peptidase I